MYSYVPPPDPALAEIAAAMERDDRDLPLPIARPQGLNRAQRRQAEQERRAIARKAAAEAAVGRHPSNWRGTSRWGRG